ncbi:hypothetical protein EIN_078840, partial [Entamoeba invadens IP1]
NEGYSFVEKKVKRAHLTERLIRIQSISKQNTTYDKQALIKLGEEIITIVDKSNEHLTTITAESLITFNNSPLITPSNTLCNSLAPETTSVTPETSSPDQTKQEEQYLYYSQNQLPCYQYTQYQQYQQYYYIDPLSGQYTFFCL